MRTSDLSEDAFVTDPSHGYRFVNFVSVFVAISQIVIRRECKKNVQFGESGHRSLGFKIAVTCACGVKSIDSCPRISQTNHQSFEINRRLVMVMKLLGISREGLNFFCGFMDLCQVLSISAYQAALQSLHTASSNMFNVSTKKAVEDEKEANSLQNKPPIDLTVSGDGSWKERGFNSLYGVTTLIGKYTGNVVDLVVKSSFCLAC